jgi:hypothetical protein
MYGNNQTSYRNMVHAGPLLTIVETMESLDRAKKRSAWAILTPEAQSEA